MISTVRISSILGLAFLAACATTDRQAAVGRGAPAGKPVFVKSQIDGAAPAALDRLLGEPTLIRREGEGEFRRYAFRDCALIVILYPDESGGVAVREIDAAAKVSGEKKPDLDLCLARGPEAAAKSS